MKLNAMLFSHYKMKKLEQKGWDYELTIPYQNDEELEKQSTTFWLKPPKWLTQETVLSRQMLEP